MTRWTRIALFAAMLSPLAADAAESPQGSNPCHIRPWQTVDNGMGAEPGGEREYASAIDFPAECTRGGLVWVPIIEFNMTRSGTGETDVDISVFTRRQQGMEAAALPGDFLTHPRMVTCEDVPVFSASQTFPFFAGPNSNQNINNLLAGDSMFVDARMVGDDTGGFFISVDDNGAPGEIPCWTTLVNGPPDEPCTNGIPDHSASGMGAVGGPFYGRLQNGDQAVGNRVGLGSVYATRYVTGGGFGGGLFDQSPPVAGGSTDIALREGPAGAVICQFQNIPDDFEFDCQLTSGQIDLLEAGGVYLERSGNGPAEAVRMLPANLHIFADGFESGDTSVWSNTVGGV